jgi:hypothetical protein
MNNNHHTNSKRKRSEEEQKSNNKGGNQLPITAFFRRTDPGPRKQVQTYAVGQLDTLQKSHEDN